MDTPTTENLHMKNRRIVAHNRRILETIRRNTKKVWVKNGGIIVGQAPAFHWRGEVHDRMIRRIIRGLYFHVFKRPLSPRVPVHASWSKPFDDPELFGMWTSFAGEDIGSDGQFRYRYAYTEQVPDITLWMFTFYDRHFATGHTGVWGD
jgi:hypothetical protein